MNVKSIVSKKLFHSDTTKGNSFLSLFFYLLIITGALYFVTIIPHRCEDCQSRYVDQELAVNISAIRQNIEYVNSIGRHPIGSKAYHTKLVPFLESKLKEIEVSASKNVDVEYKRQISNFSFTQDLFFNNTNNFLFRIKPKDIVVKMPTLLMNCHLDSSVEGAGISDDFVNCAIMLEIGRLYAKGKFEMKNSLLLLFNEGEEFDMIGSTAFLEENEWAKEVIAAINLEGAGSGGRLFMFQTFPQGTSYTFLNAYRSTFVAPMTSIQAQNIYQSGLTSSYTDFRLFREYGIPAMDLAYTNEGYSYHTSSDTSDRITDKCNSNNAFNLLGLVNNLVADENLANKMKERSHNQRIFLVFYDFFSLFTLIYHNIVELTFNIILIGLNFYMIYRFKCKWREFLVIFFIQLGWIIFAGGLVYAGAIIQNKFLVKMTFFNHQYNSLIMYLFPLVFFSVIYLYILYSIFLYFILERDIDFKTIFNSFITYLDCETRGRLFGTIFIIDFLIILILSSVIAGLNFSIFFIQIGSFCGFCIIFVAEHLQVLSSWWRYPIFIIPFSLTVSLPSTYYIYIIADFFIPIFGRSKNFEPDQAIALIIIFAFFIPALMVFPQVVLVHKTCVNKLFVIILIILWILYVIIINNHEQGFPYGITRPFYFEKSQNSSRRFQRVRMFQLDQYEENTYRHSGIYLTTYDVNGVDYLKPDGDITQKNFPEAYKFEPLRGIKKFDDVHQFKEFGLPGDEFNFLNGYYIPVMDKIKDFPDLNITINAKNLTLNIDLKSDLPLIGLTFKVPKYKIRIKSINDLTVTPRYLSSSKDPDNNYYFQRFYNPTGEWHLQVEASKSTTEIINGTLKVMMYAYDLSETYGNSISLENVTSKLPSWTVVNRFTTKQINFPFNL